MHAHQITRTCKSQKPIIQCMDTYLRASQVESSLIQPAHRPLSSPADPLTERSCSDVMLWVEHLSLSLPLSHPGCCNWCVVPVNAALSRPLRGTAITPQLRNAVTKRLLSWQQTWTLIHFEAKNYWVLKT